MGTPYSIDQPTRGVVDGYPGATVLEFGTDWCGFCKGAQPHITKGLATVPGLRHLKVEDGPGRPLGRSFKIKLWPTLVILRDGKEVARVVRPQGVDDVTRGLAALA
jgi:thioredoxin 1